MHKQTRFESSSRFRCSDECVLRASQRVCLSQSAVTARTTELSMVSCLNADCLDGREMYGRKALERTLSELGRTPRISVSLPHFLALPALLENTDLAAIIPRPLARSLECYTSYRRTNCPINRRPLTSACCGTSGRRKMRRKHGCARCLGARPSLCAVALARYERPLDPQA
jgi:hypothetical protein